MSRILAAALILCAAVWARDKHAPAGQADNELIALDASVLNGDDLKQKTGSDFDNNFVVIEVTLTPRGGKPFDVHLDDFLLRSDQTGDHSGPLAASQIAGSGALIVHRTYENGGAGGQRTRTMGGLGGIMMGGG